MKKLFSIFAIGLALVSCSDDKTNDLVTPTIPLGDVTLQPATPDAPADENVPEVSNYVLSGSNYIYTYENGQVLTFSGNTLIAIDGTAPEVIIPSEYIFERTEEDGTTNRYRRIVNNINIPTYPTGTDVVKTIVVNIKNIEPYNGTFQESLNRFPNLENIVLADQFPDYVAINGAIYTSDLKTFVYCPRGKKGEFAIADGTEVIAAHSFDPAGNITRLVVPASVTEIEDEAILHTDALQVIDMLPTTAPIATAQAFGHFAQRSTMCIPEGSLDSYTGYTMPTKPIEPKEPIAPAEPGEDATEAELEAYNTAYEAYTLAYAEYQEAYAEYEEAYAEYTLKLTEYTNHAGYMLFTNLKEVTFNIK